MCAHLHMQRCVDFPNVCNWTLALATIRTLVKREVLHFVGSFCMPLKILKIAGALGKIIMQDINAY